jgi:membrane-bound lytic murein transglycosylase B
LSADPKDSTEYTPSGIAHLPPEAATCRDPAGFEAWLAGFKREAAANGISGSALSALDGLTYDASMEAKDHGQHVFHQSFEQFAGRMVNSYRL